MHRLERIVRAKLPDKGALATFTSKFWYDSVNGFGPALQCACNVFGADRILPGSDYPFFRDDDYQWQIDYLANRGLPENDVKAIRDDNVRRLFEGVSGAKMVFVRSSFGIQLFCLSDVRDAFRTAAGGHCICIG